MIEFFVHMKKIPTITHQEKKINFKDKRIYEPRELAEARALFMELLSQHRPAEPIGKGIPIHLTVYWYFPLINGKHIGQLKTTKPDLDNHLKLLQDCMTKLGYWADDNQIALLSTGKLYGEKPGIWIRAEEVEEGW